MVQPAGTGELSPHYYRDNFLALCDTVEAQYADLLTAEERALLADFRQLDFEAQCLYVRLVSRVGPWFRESRLAYAELGEIAPLVDTLLAARLVAVAEGLAVAELGRLFTVTELRRGAGSRLTGPPPRGKPALLDALAELALDEAGYLQLMVTVDGKRIIAPCGVAEVQLFQLLFFGNRRQSLTDFVLSDLGIARYYPYLLDREHRLFPHREALEEYLACAACSDAWHDLRDSGDADGLLALADTMLASEVRFSSTEGRWYRLCNGVARDLERLGALDTALQLYQRSHHHPARERRLRILERLEDWPAAAALGGAILAAPWCEEEFDAGSRVLPRIRRRLGQKPGARPRDAFARLDLVLPPQRGSVERQVAKHLEPGWQSVHYVENSLMNALFGLAFWEQIFMPIPGAFHNPYQSVPTDMYGPEFLARRRQALEHRLRLLGEGDIGAILAEAYNNYGGYQCRWVDWRMLDAALLATVTRVIPGGHLLAVWQRMLFDPRENRRGFPDLLALGETPGEYCLIEVKGPGDALQDSQKRWLRFFRRQGIPASVAWVSRGEPVGG
jgi:hypothetical protein